MFQALLAHDLSARSEIALFRGARLAQERDGHLTIVHLVDSDLPAPVIEAQQRHAGEYLELDVRRLWGVTSRPSRDRNNPTTRGPGLGTQ